MSRDAFRSICCYLVTQSCPTLLTPWTLECQAPLFKEFSRQEYWSGLPCPHPGGHPNSGIEPESLALQADSFTAEPPSGRTKPSFHLSGIPSLTLAVF